MLTMRSRPSGVRRAFLRMSIRLPQGQLTSRQHQLPRLEPNGQPSESSHLGNTTAAAAAFLEARPGAFGGFRIAAGFDRSGGVTELYNGKIDRPAVAGRALS